MVDLKNATAACHEELHDIPYFKTIMKETIAKYQYASHLRSLGVIWTSLEYQPYLNPILVSQQLPMNLGLVWSAIEKEIQREGNEVRKK